MLVIPEFVSPPAVTELTADCWTAHTFKAGLTNVGPSLDGNWMIGDHHHPIPSS
jgi:hypothetical protein